MPQFDVYEHEDGLVINCQSDLLSGLTTRFVVPLLDPDIAPKAANRLNPQFNLNGRSFTMMTQYASNVEKRTLGPVVLSLADHNIEITSAIDMLMNGY